MGLPINLTRKGYSRLIEAKKMVMLSYISTIKLTKQVLFLGGGLMLKLVLVEKKETSRELENVSLVMKNIKVERGRRRKRFFLPGRR
jgi:hypothetical protein